MTPSAAPSETLWRVLRIVAEPGGAAAFAALLSGSYRPREGERVGVVVCGGNRRRWTSAAETRAIGGQMDKGAVTTSRIAPPVGPFSPAIRSGGMLYLSGQVAQDPATGRLVDGDVSRQTEQIFAKVSSVLEAADMTFANVVRVGVFLTDIGTSRR